MDTKRLVVRFFLFALLGLLMEVFFTATFAGIGGNINLRGHTSPWMMIDYGLLGVVLLPIKGALVSWGFPLAARAFVYMVGIFVVEYVSGLVFVAFGLKIWDYSHLPYNLHGQITLLYAPFWYALGLGVELLHRKIDAIAVLLLRGLEADDLPEAPTR